MKIFISEEDNFAAYYFLLLSKWVKNDHQCTLCWDRSWSMFSKFQEKLTLNSKFTVALINKMRVKNHQVPILVLTLNILAFESLF